MRSAYLAARCFGLPSVIAILVGRGLPALTGDAPFPASLLEGAASAQLAEASYERHRERRWVDLPLTHRREGLPPLEVRLPGRQTDREGPLTKWAGVRFWQSAAAQGLPLAPVPSGVAIEERRHQLGLVGTVCP